jgi:hypothetical protein
MPNRKFLLSASLSMMVLVLLPHLSGRQKLKAQEKRFHFEIDPKASLKDLLPTPPRASQVGPQLFDELARVPEVQFQEPLRIHSDNGGFGDFGVNGVLDSIFPTTKEELLELTAHQIANINFLNRDKRDHFMELLIEHRPDLAGLPFVMGNACRLDKERGADFRKAVSEVRELDEDLFGIFLFGKQWETRQNQEYISALMQMHHPESSPISFILVSHLAHFKEKEATLALVRLALYAEKAGVRQAALRILKKRCDPQIEDHLLRGIHYPWPEVAKNAAEAITYLKTADLVPQLVSFLDEPDPRSPTYKRIKGKTVPVVRELVRLNHNRSCLLCHPPGNTSDIKPGEILTGPVPNPGDALSPSRYEEPASPDILVRADVTYLRQDFSRMQKVADPAPWPEMQRFDFLVRTRILTEAEAKRYQAEFAKLEKSSPYRQAALNALRALTGLDAEPTAAAWRKALAQKNAERK